MSFNAVKREKVDFLAPLVGNDTQASMQLAARMVSEAKTLGLNMRDYLTFKIDVQASNDNGKFVVGDRLLNGYEAALSVLNLPLRNDLEAGVMLQAAAQTFQTYAGTRILFPQVVDDVAKFTYRQTGFEKVDALVGSSRVINGNEVLYMVVNDDGSEYRKARAIAEGGNIPVYMIKGSEKAAKIWKFGMGFQTTYEFERRASIDLLTPYVARSQREIELSKVAVATQVLINGDGVHGAAPEVNQSSFNGVAGIANATAGKMSYQHLLAWLVSRAKAGLPIDTIVGNYDAYLAWLMLFAVPSTDKSATDVENMAKAGFAVRGLPILQGTVDFALSSTAPAGKLIGYSKADTLEEMVESGSQINESEKAIKTQTVTYTRTENSGYRLVFGDTRSVFDYAEA